MDWSVLPKDEIWFLSVCHHISNGLYHVVWLVVITIQDSMYSRSIFRVYVENVAAPSLFLRICFTVYQTMWCHTVTLRSYKNIHLYGNLQFCGAHIILPKEQISCLTFV